jgi:hypothetical protein
MQTNVWQTERWLKQRLVLALVTITGPAVYGPQVYGLQVRAPLPDLGPFPGALWGAMVLIRLSMALPSFLPSDQRSADPRSAGQKSVFPLVFRGPRFSFQGFRSPLSIEDGSRRSVHGPLVRRRECFPPLPDLR